MGSSGDCDGPINPLQQNPNDSEALRSPLPGEKSVDSDGLQPALSPVHFQDTIFVDEGVDTQALNLDEETQVWEYPEFVECVRADGACETQVVDFGGETQVLDDVDDTSTQLINEVALDSDSEEMAPDSDSEEMDATQVLFENDCLSDYESRRRDESQTSDINYEVIDGHRGSVPRFVSLRVKAMRASALAARIAASRRTNNEFCSLQTGNKSLEKETVESSDPTPNKDDANWKTDCRTAESNRNKSNLGCSAAAEPFHEDSFIGSAGLSRTSDNLTRGKVAIRSPSASGELSQLSYVDSQEPGELSQGNALACVQKLIEQSKELLGTDNWDQIGQGTSNCIASTNGQHILAKKANQIGRKEKSVIFDWDDNVEDEGGGDIFQRRKEEFLGSRNLRNKSLTEPKKAKQRLFDGFKAVSVDSGIGGNTQTDVTMRKNLIIDFDKDAMSNKMESTLTKKKTSERHGLDFYAETASGSMEPFARVGTSGLDAVDGRSIHSVAFKDSLRRSTRNNVSLNTSSPKNSYCLRITAIRLKKGKRVHAQSSLQSSSLTPKHHKSYQKECHAYPIMTRKRAREASDAQKHCESVSGRKMGSRNIKQGRVDYTNNSLVQCHVDALMGDTEDRMQDMQEVTPVMPITHRTRLQLVSQNASKRVSGDTAYMFKSSYIHGEMKAGSSTRVEAVELSTGKNESLVQRHGNTLRGDAEVRMQESVHGDTPLIAIARQTRQSLLVSQNVSKEVSGNTACIFKSSDTRDTEAGSSTREPVELSNGKNDSMVQPHGDTLVGDAEVRMQDSVLDVTPLIPIARRTRRSVSVFQNVSKQVSGDFAHTSKSSDARDIKSGSSTRAEAVELSNGNVRQVSGGTAHIFRSSDTWDIKTGSSIRLEEVKLSNGKIDSLVQLHVDAIMGNVEVRRQDSLQEVTPLVPIARRTRRSLLVSQNVSKQVSGDIAHNFKSSDIPREMKAESSTRVEPGELSKGKNYTDCSPFADNECNTSSGKLITKSPVLECASPTNCMTHANAVSPVCLGDGYCSPSCKRNLSGPSLAKEISSLSATRPRPEYTLKDLRRRRDLTAVRVRFSHHLDEDITKKQQKIMDWLKISIASSIVTATHFVTDKFVRTRNMLEAIASGKPVVTPLWLENVGQTKCYIDEENYILRDVKKEKEIGFNLPASLALARQHPLLQNQKVLITSRAKPSKDILLSLVQKVHGKPIKRVGRSIVKDGMIPQNFLILSCEDDYEACVPFLEKGMAVYSSELLLNGIVTQKLEYGRYKLFQDKVKRTRSTIRMEKDGCSFIPVTKH